MPNLFKQTLLALFICIMLVSAAYWWVDKPVVFFVAKYHHYNLQFFKWFTHIPDIVNAFTFLIFLIVMIRFGYTKLGHTDKMIFAVANSVAITYFLRGILKIIFGRYWPATWVDNNLSLLHDNAYGFNWFHGGESYASFPSGHAAGIFAAMTIFWLLYPRWRWLIAIPMLLVIIGLIAMNYHFVSDIIAGAFLGAIVASYTAKYSGITAK